MPTTTKRGAIKAVAPPAVVIPASAAEAVLAALTERPGATAAQLAEAARVGRSTANKALAGLAADGKAVRTRGGMQGARILPDTWTLGAPADAGAPTPGSADPTGTDSGRRKRGVVAAEAHRGDRLGKGGLQALIVDHLRTLEGKEGTSSSVAKALSRSSGATGNALQRLAEQGTIVQTCTTPRRYAWRG